MISQGNENKEAILHAITSVHSGLFDCEYENNLFKENNEYATTIKALKAMAKSDEHEYPSLLDMIKNRFCTKKEKETPTKATRKAQTIDAIEDKTIAYYAGLDTHNETNISKLIIDMGTKEISITRKNKLSGTSILADNKILALKKAGTTLLDAYDAGAEVIVVEDEASYDMFRTHFKSIENIMGRKMIGLEVLLAEDFVIQSSLLEA
jgi:hypothetical protein